MEKERNISTLALVGGNLGCDFINTVYAWRGENLHEYLGSYADFIVWCHKANVVDLAILTELQHRADAEPEAAEAVLGQIKKIRLLLYSFISAVAAQQTAEIKKLLPSLTALLHKGGTHLVLRLDKDTFSLSLPEAPGNLLSPVWMVLQSLQDMLLATNLKRIKECPRCGWVFVDTTKNGRRRWCEPEECGTADKMQRYYAKRKRAEEEKNSSNAGS